MSEPKSKPKGRLSPWLIWIGAGIGCGCLGLVLLVVGGAALLGFALVRASDLHDEVLDRIRADPQAMEALGAPIDSDFFPAGSVHYSDNLDRGEATFTLSITGSASSAEIEVDAYRDDGPWIYRVLELEFEDGRTLDLREP